MNYFDKTQFHITKISHLLAKYFVEKHHYTHKMGLSRTSYGIFHILNEKCNFFDVETSKLIGVIVYSQPVGRSAAESISSLIKIDEVLELTRLVCLDGENYGKNLESYFISQSLKFIQKEFPKIKAIISYSDNEQGHRGVIYQATGFGYQGNSSLALMPNFSISLVGPPYKWIHSRTVFSTFGSHNVEHLKKKIGHTFFRKKEATKHRYVYILGNKIQKRKILSNLKHPFLPYPKNVKFTEEIEKIEVEKYDNLFFT